MSRIHSPSVAGSCVVKAKCNNLHLEAHALFRAQPASAHTRSPSTWTPAWPFFAFRVIRDAVIASDE